MYHIVGYDGSPICMSPRECEETCFSRTSTVALDAERIRQRSSVPNLHDLSATPRAKSLATIQRQSDFHFSETCRKAPCS
jgi:hypothetical protein